MNKTIITLAIVMGFNLHASAQEKKKHYYDSKSHRATRARNFNLNICQPKYSL